MASAVLADARSHPSPPSLRAFLVVLPDGSVKLYERSRMTVSDVIAEFPHHFLSLNSSMPRQLLPETELLPHNTYYLQSPPLPLPQSPAYGTPWDDVAGSAPVSGRQRKRLSLSDQFPVRGASDTDHTPRGVEVDDPTTEFLQKRSTFPGPMPHPPISQQFTRQQTHPRTYLPAELQMQPQKDKQATFFIQEDDVTGELGPPVIPKSRTTTDDRHRHQALQEQYRARGANRRNSIDDSDFSLTSELDYAGMQAQRGAVPLAHMHMSLAFSRLPPLPSNPGFPEGSVPANSVPEGLERRRTQSRQTSADNWPLIGGEDSAALAQQRGLCELQNFSVPGQFSQAFGRLPILPSAAQQYDDQHQHPRMMHTLVPLRSTVGQGAHRENDRPAAPSRSKSREEVLEELREFLSQKKGQAPARIRRTSSVSNASSRGEGGTANSRARTNSILAELEEMEVEEGQTDVPGEMASALTLPLEAPSAAEMSFQHRMQQQQQQQHREEGGRDGAKSSRGSKGGALFTKFTVKFGRTRGSRGSRSLDIDQNDHAGF